MVNVHQIFNEIMSGDLPPETILANAIENNLPNSYTQRKDYAETLQRKAAIATVEAYWCRKVETRKNRTKKPT